MSDSWRPCLLAPAALALFTVPGENMRRAHVLTRHSKSRVRRSRATSRPARVWAPGIRVILTF